MRKTTALTLLGLVLALPAAAPAAVVVAPPGLPEAEQYFETQPTSTGPKAPDLTKKARDAVRNGTLDEATEEALRRRGPTGLALAEAVAQTAPQQGRRPQTPSLEALGEQGMGAVFPLLLVLAAAAAAAFAVARRRTPAR
ncbi:MAG: hypothetical protein ACM3N0_01170 [Chloroflexota bacterium]